MCMYNDRNGLIILSINKIEQVISVILNKLAKKKIKRLVLAFKGTFVQ